MQTNIYQHIFNLCYTRVLGTHPQNTIFAFNYHNVRHIIAFFTRVIKDNFPKRSYVIVDVGAGYSPYYYLFSNKAGRYIAVDIAGSLPKGDRRPIEQVEGVAESIPLEDAMSDIVLCNQVLEHVDDPLKSAGEMYRILKPGGVLIGSAPQVSPIHLEPHDYWRFTEFGIKKLFQKAGFTDIYVEGNGGVHKTAVLIVAMDWMLSTRKSDETQKFSQVKALLLSPLIALMNVLALFFDKIIGDKNRTPANLCWIAKKAK